MNEQQWYWGLYPAHDGKTLTDLQGWQVCPPDIKPQSLPNFISLDRPHGANPFPIRRKCPHRTPYRPYPTGLNRPYRWHGKAGRIAPGQSCGSPRSTDQTAQRGGQSGVATGRGSNASLASARN